MEDLVAHRRVLHSVRGCVRGHKSYPFPSFRQSDWMFKSLKKREETCPNYPHPLCVHYPETPADTWHQHRSCFTVSAIDHRFQVGDCDMRIPWIRVGVGVHTALRMPQHLDDSIQLYLYWPDTSHGTNVNCRSTPALLVSLTPGIKRYDGLWTSILNRGEGELKPDARRAHWSTPRVKMSVS